MTTLRTRLVGLAATVATLALVAGFPALLIAIDATPVPTSVPSWDTVVTALTTRDDGTLTLRVLAVVAWGGWAFLTFTIALDVWARLRRLRAPTLPGLALPQSAAHTLVGAAVLLFAAAPTLAPTTPAAAAPPPAATAQPWHATADPVAGQPSPTATPHAALRKTAPTSPLRAATTRHTVVAGESLWSIARDHLGDATRYAQIAALNAHVLNGDPELIHPGTILTLPPVPAPGTPTGTRAVGYTVQRGDTLSGIAHDSLGDADRYREIFDASRDTTQPGGAHLVDPDVIDVGWTLTIPTRDTADADQATPASPGAPALVPAPPHPPTTPRRPAGDADRADTPPSSSRSAASAPAPPKSPEVPGTGHAATDDHNGQAPAAWLVAGLTGGPVLAGSMWMLLRRRRAAQSRHRRPGRTLPAPSPVLAPVEKTLATTGSAAAAGVELVDDALRVLACARARTGQAMPALTGVEVAPTAVIVRLATPDVLPHPWTDTGGDGRTWRLPADTDTDSDVLGGGDVPGQPAPYPLLVTVGTTDTGNPWLLNFEDLTVTLTGDPTNAADLARYIAAEIACNPWSAGVTVHCTGPAADVAPLNPDRIRPHRAPAQPSPPNGGDAAADAGHSAHTVLAEVVTAIDNATDEQLDTITARAHQAGDDTWPARMLLLDPAHAHTPVVGQLLDLVSAHPGRTGTAVVITGAHPHKALSTLELTATGRVLVEHAGLDLVAVGLTRDEARGCAALLAAATDTTDTAIPVDDTADTGWRSFTDQAGALRPQHTLPRDTPDPDVGQPAQCILPAPDATYLQQAATTSADLAVLAPKVPAAVRDALAQADPTLDDDVAAWFADDCPLPRLSLLGPVSARTRGAALTQRKPYMTEVLAYLATRPHGATPDQLAHVMRIQPDKARDYVSIVRDWLGTNPRTGTPHLPGARQAPAAKTAGVGVYQVVDLLVDADLFRRLRARGLSRGADGITDLETALSLVRGRPFDQRREGGWAWLFEGDRLDQQLVCAIVDVAHTLTTAHLISGDHARARTAAQTALLAAPEEDIPRLDLARVTHAQGLHRQAQQILLEHVYNRTDDDNVPPDLPERTAQVITGPWARNDAG